MEIKYRLQVQDIVGDRHATFTGLSMQEAREKCERYGAKYYGVNNYQIVDVMGRGW